MDKVKNNPQDFSDLDLGVALAQEQELAQIHATNVMNLKRELMSRHQIANKPNLKTKEQIRAENTNLAVPKKKKEDK